MTTRRPRIGLALPHADQARSPGHPYRPYLDAIAAGGGEPVQLRLLKHPADLRPVYDKLDGLCLAGGPDLAPTMYQASRPDLCQPPQPRRDEVEQTLCRWARADHKPLLAICRGLQMLNVVWGGTLYEDIHAYRPAALNHATKTFLPRDLIVHTVGVELDSLLARWLDLPHAGGRVSVNSRHHQAIRELAPGLRVTARAPDGIIEAVEGSADGRTYAVGVQWHPENMVGSHPAMRRLFVGFCALCSDGTR